MDTETQRADKEAAANANPETCPSCGTPLVGGMRFCRACGYRLGEGMAEYVETVRFDRMADFPGMSAGNQPTGAQTTVMSPIATAPQIPARQRRRGRKLIAVLLFLVVLIPAVGVGGVFLFRAARNAAQQKMAELQIENGPRSFLGADDFYDTDGAGALLAEAMPGSPAEQAGLLDGDIITKYDGKTINGENALREALHETPIGKTVEVVYLRDGETKTTKLTTISNEDYNSDAFMPPERGFLGVDDTERIAIEGTKIYGVRLGEVYANRPADLAGLKQGDIVVEFDGKPVRTPEGLNGYITLAKPTSTVNVVVYRDGERTTIPVKMGRRT
ncbi:MAG TPA: PDZ domain-containing protein [Pyrinomonadaceae bacterium]|nr:PDZ domain-containing protein [Pyrinomonadaceae bacterium]